MCAPVPTTVNIVDGVVSVYSTSKVTWAQVQTTYKLFHTYTLLMAFYLESCIWLDTITRWIRQLVYIKFCANSGKSVMETLTVISKHSGKKS
jgi:hypothetical protein